MSKLKAYCHAHYIPVPYYLDGAHLTTGDYLDAIEQRLNSQGLSCVSAFSLRRVKMFRARVLNPLAHWSPVVIDASEVQRAIAVVREMKFADDRANFAGKTREALAAASPTPAELLDAATWLRTLFEVDLRNFLIKHGGQVGYRFDWQKLSDAELWDAAKVRMQAVNAVEAPLVTAAVESHGFAFLDSWDYERVSLLTKAQLDAAWVALRAPGQAPRTRLAIFA